MSDNARRFEQMVSQLRWQDPQFVARVEKLRQPARWRIVAVHVLMWVTPPIFILVGGWTGFLIASVACAYGVCYLRRVKPRQPDTDRRSENHRPTW